LVGNVAVAEAGTMLRTLSAAAVMATARERNDEILFN
jgi:hypothetical protein